MKTENLIILSGKDCMGSILLNMLIERGHKFIIDDRFHTALQQTSTGDYHKKPLAARHSLVSDLVSDSRFFWRGGI